MEKFFDRKTISIISFFLLVPTILLLVSSISAKISNQSALVTTISVAVGLTSLILSVIAIIQNIVSGRPAENILMQVGQATSQMMRSVNDLSDSTSLLNKAAQDVSDKAIAVHQTMSDFSMKADAAFKNISQVQSTALMEPRIKHNSDIEDPVRAKNSNGGIIAYYIAAKSFINSKVVPEKIIFPGDYLRGYFDGYMACMVHAGKIESSRTDDGDLVVTKLITFTADQADISIDKDLNPEFVNKYIEKIDAWISGKSEEAKSEAASK